MNIAIVTLQLNISQISLSFVTQAKRRLADEYDAAQERGEVAANGQRGKAVPDGNSLATVSDLGLTRKAIHEARQLRDAEAIICVHCDKYAPYSDVVQDLL